MIMCDMIMWEYWIYRIGPEYTLNANVMTRTQYHSHNNTWLLTCLFRSSIIRAIWIFFLPILANFWSLPVECLSMSFFLPHSTFWSLQTFFLLSSMKTKEKWNIRLLQSVEDGWFNCRRTEGEKMVWLRKTNTTGTSTVWIDYPAPPQQPLHNGMWVGVFCGNM